ncbi:hypothetical protein D3C87_75420 [compost metagenome]
MASMKYTYEVMLGLAAEMVLDSSIKQEKIKKLNASIEKALETNDQEAFMRLTEELKELQLN